MVRGNPDAKGAKPQGERDAERAVRPAVGVVGGDRACIHAVVHHWTGRPASKVLTGAARAARVSGGENRRDIVILQEPSASLNPWPGGPLIWLYPERGPSELELAQMRLALSANATSSPRLRILLCLPQDVDPDSAEGDLDIISDTLRWAVDPGVEMEVEAVWLSGDQGPTLFSWLVKLG